MLLTGTMRRLAPGFVRYLRGRARALAAPAALACVVHACSTRPPERTLDGVASWLGASVGGTVRPGELAWETPGNAFSELVFGRGLWFLATTGAGGSRDLYRASVRLWPNGQPLRLSQPVNWSDTPGADESGLAVDGARVLFGTVAGGKVASVTVLDGETVHGGALSRLATRVTTGLWSPLARTDVFVETPAGAAAAKLEREAVALELGGTEHRVELGAKETPAGHGDGIARAVAHAPGEGSARLELVRLARALFGVELTAWVGRGALGLAALGGATRAADLHATGNVAFRPVVSPLMKAPLGADPGAHDARAPYFERASVPGAGGRTAVELVGIDLEQLELGVQAGSEWPKASLGAPGEGRLPSDPELRRRVVAVFNAGPEAAYERYGTMAHGRLLVAPEPERPSIVVSRARGAVLGPWPFGDEVPEDVLGFTQRRSALVHAHAVVPATDHSLRRRSALCAVSRSRLVYAYADALDPQALATALVAAGCEEAVPLAASPEALGFVLVDAANGANGRFEPLDPHMDFDARATLTGSTRDFFYLSARDVRPKAPPGMLWHPDGGTEPEPAWLPAILSGELTLGGVTLALTSFELRRLELRVRPGPLEPGAKGQPWAGALAEAERMRALAALELGHATGAARHGLALGALIPLPLRPAYATLVVGNGTARILLPGEAVTLGAAEQAVQLPLLADDADVTARARERGDARLRSALGVTDDGRLVVATLRHDSSDPLAVGLRAAGCRRVVELDRGSHHPAALERAGSEHPPREAPDSSTLWLLSRAKR